MVNPWHSFPYTCENNDRPNPLQVKRVKYGPLAHIYSAQCQTGCPENDRGVVASPPFLFNIEKYFIHRKASIDTKKSPSVEAGKFLFHTNIFRFGPCSFLEVFWSWGVPNFFKPLVLPGNQLMCFFSLVLVS